MDQKAMGLDGWPSLGIMKNGSFFRARQVYVSYNREMGILIIPMNF